MKQLLKTMVLAILVSAIANAGAIKTWAAGDTVNAADLNAALQHIHNAMVGGHGARLINADVNASANISYSKLNLTNSVVSADIVDGTITTSDIASSTIVNSNISASAAIADSKIVNGTIGIARAWVRTSTTICTSGTCSLSGSANVTSVTWVSTGLYTVTLSTTLTDTNYATVANLGGGVSSAVVCFATPASTTTVTVKCTDGTAVVQNASFSLVVFDDN